MNTHVHVLAVSCTTHGAAAVARCEVGRDLQLSCGEHRDYGLLTLVLQEPHLSALQVKNAAGEWVDAPPMPGSFVVNIGDMMEVCADVMEVVYCVRPAIQLTTPDLQGLQGQQQPQPIQINHIR